MTKLRLKDWREVVREDWPKQPVTESTRQTIRRAAESCRYLINDMRLATSRVYTDLEYESRRAKRLDRPLP